MKDFSHSSTVAPYAEPSFDEMLRLCVDFGLISEFDEVESGIRLRAVNQTFRLSIEEARVLMQGLLLGFFYGHSRDDLRLARWDP